jgi:metallophosphoesterase superfamily enzyme
VDPVVTVGVHERFRETDAHPERLGEREHLAGVGVAGRHREPRPGLFARGDDPEDVVVVGHLAPAVHARDERAERDAGPPVEFDQFDREAVQ